MSKTKNLASAKFLVGTEVRVKTGVTLPDLPDIPLGIGQVRSRKSSPTKFHLPHTRSNGTRELGLPPSN